MPRLLKILTISLIMMVGSGCATKPLYQPFCISSDDRPVLEDVSNQEKFDLHLANPEALEKLAINDARLKNHIETIEAAASEHNKQFKAKCQ